MNPIVLDTNAYVAFCKGDVRVVRAVAGAGRVLMSTIVIGELLFGFRHGSRYEQNVASLQSFLAEPVVDVVPVTLATSERYGMISASLRSKGKPIPTNDIWIAAHAAESVATLLTFDEHFDHVDGLDVRRP